MCVYLPRHLARAEGDGAAEPAPAAVPHPRLDDGRAVLVVDDEPTVRMLLADILPDLGLTAIEAADGEAALKVLRSGARVDLLVTDVGLPGGLNGRQLADLARQGRPGLPVLLITGYAENAVLGAGSLGPGMGVLTKPFGVDAMSARIRGLVGRG
jgi:CheY-like chemotaxis protein